MPGIYMTVIPLLRTINKNMNRYFTILFVLIAFISSCQRSKTPVTNASPGTYYTCSMHPEIRCDKPGKCTVCKMELIIAHDQANGNNGISLTDRQIELANIKLDTVKSGNIGEEIEFPGKIVADPDKVQVISSRVGGRIDNLNFKTPGQTIKKGDLIYEIYSDDIISAQKEYYLAVSNKNITGGNPFIKAAENKLKLWGLTGNQINNIAAGKIYQPDIPVYSPFSGTISQVMVQEGATVMEGSPVLRLSDYSSVRVEAQVFGNEIKDIMQGAEVDIRIPAFANKKFNSKINFIYPELPDNSQVVIVRAELANSDLKLTPGMEADINFSKGSKEAVVVPRGSILYSKMGPVVWIRMPDKSFEIRMVRTGIEGNENIEILSGINEGDIVVSSGAYLINSEYILKKNSDPMAGMKM
jgi:membrane fusion protein, copper/silver efflux system